MRVMLVGVAWMRIPSGTFSTSMRLYEVGHLNTGEVNWSKKSSGNPLLLITQKCKKRRNKQNKQGREKGTYLSGKKGCLGPYLLSWLVNLSFPSLFVHPLLNYSPKDRTAGIRHISSSYLLE
jgi:hypothetical protein